MSCENTLHLASRGASLIIEYAKSADAVEKVVAEIEAPDAKAIAIRGDVSKPLGIVSLCGKLFSTTVTSTSVISDSGYESSGHTSEITPKGFHRVSTILRSTLAASYLLYCKRTSI